MTKGITPKIKEYSTVFLIEKAANWGNHELHVFTLCHKWKHFSDGVIVKMISDKTIKIKCEYITESGMTMNFVSIKATEY